MSLLKTNLQRGLFLLLFLFPFITFAQDSSEIEMADAFREQGKIYVVIAVIGIILLGLIIYLALIDRKVSKIEKRIKKEN